MNPRKPRRSGRSARRLALVLLSALALPTIADVVSTIDQGSLGGTLSLDAGQERITVTDEAGKTTTLRMIDIDQVRFHTDLKPAQSDQQLVIDNDKGVGARQKADKAKLRAGLHRITIPYWQDQGGHKLELYVAGPGINGRVELGADHLRCFRDTEDTTPASAGIDEQGYRLPELALSESDNRRRMLSRARYRLYAGQDGQPINSVNSLNQFQLKRSGTTSAINTGMLNEHNQTVGLVFDAFFIAPQDGEYQFTLISDDGSQFYLGQVSEFDSDQFGEPPVHAPWRFELANNGRAFGELKSIADETLTLHLPLVSDVNIALSHIRAVWDKKTDPTTINRDNEPGNEDTVYLRDKNDETAIRSVSGRVVGLSETALSFVFRGEERSITRDRVVGVVFRHSSRPAPSNAGLHQVLLLQGGQVLPCQVKAIGEQVRFQLLGGSEAAPPREVALAMRVENGRRIDLTQLAPTAEEAIPYFGLKLPHQVNTDFSGKPIMLYDEKVYERGLSVHSKSRLHYKLMPNCQRFMASFGLLNPGGKLGDVTARVLGDNKVLWEQANITAATGVIEIDVPLTGVERLVLEVDFGEGQNVGDRAAWCSPRLIYSGETP